MARKPRAFYHVINRGNSQQALFLDDSNREYDLDRFKHYRKRSDTSELEWV
jgi:hypothetical protein